MVLTSISAHSVWHLNVSVLDLRASGSEFQRTLPEYYARLKKSIIGIGILVVIGFRNI